jgi:hypothetical protein
MNRLKRIFDLKLDFTFAKYVELCREILDSDCSILTVEKYLTMEKRPDKFVIIRHDIDDDADLAYALKMAKFEAELGIATTYYFRTCKSVFKIDVIKEIATMGHEIGYHYEVLGDAEGDYGRAIRLFETELNKFKNVSNVKTIAQHGGPLRSGLNVVTLSGVLGIIKNMLQRNNIFDHWESKNLWKKYDFKKYGIIGEVYLSIDYSKVAYLSDTNRTWIDSSYRLKDYVEEYNEKNSQTHIKNTDELIENVKGNNLQKFIILVHPSNWKESFREWLTWLILQQVRNTGKRCLVAYWKTRKSFGKQFTEVNDNT